MRNIPTIYPTVVFTIIFTGTHATGEAVIERFYPLAVLIFRVEETSLGIIYIAIIASAFQIVGGIFFLTQSIGNTGQTPLVVRSSQRNSNRLTFLKRIYIRVGFFFTCLKRRNISVLLIKIVYPTGSSTRPRSQCLFFYSFAASFVSFRQVELQTFCSSIGYCGYGMIGVHTAGISCYLRESRHPHIAHLFRHAKVGVDHILFCSFIDQETQRMGSTVGIPNPVVGKERFALVFMHFTVERTEVTTAFADTYRTFEDTIKRSI